MVQGVHLRVKENMTVSRLGSIKAWVGTGRAIFPSLCTNLLKRKPSLCRAFNLGIEELSQSGQAVIENSLMSRCS